MSSIALSSLLTPPDSSSTASIPIAPPKGTPPPENGTLLPEVKTAEAPATDDDVKMEDVQSPNPTLNGVAHSSQEEPSPTATAGSAAMPAVSSSATVVDALAASPYSNYMSNNDDDKPPPAKRARKWSDAEKASVANVSRFCYVRRPGRADPDLHHVIPSEDRNPTSSVTFSRPGSA